MRVAIVLNTSWNIYNFRLGLVRAFIDRGFEVHAIAPTDKFSEKLQEEGCIFHPLKMDSRGVNPIKDIALIAELRRIYKKVNPDVVLHYTIKPNIYGTFAASSLGIPAINNVCGLGTAFLQNNLMAFVARWLYRISFRSSRKIFFQNKDDQDYFLFKKIIGPGKSDLLPGSGIDVTKFSINEQNREAQKSSKFTFILVSRLIYDKGIVEYVEAIRHLRKKGLDARFQLLGPTDFKHRRGIPKELIDDWVGENILEYLGTTEDVRENLAKADCIVLPSYREGTPRTLLEAASMSKPIVATDVAGCTNIVENEYNGLLCNQKDSIDLAEKMESLYNMGPTKRHEMGIRGRKIVKDRFDERLVVDKYLGEIQSISR